MRVLVCSSIAPQPLIMMMKMSMLSYICSLEVLHYLDVWSSPFCIAFFPTKLVTQIFVRRVFGVVYKLRTEYMPPANREPVSCFHRVSIQKQNPARYGFSFLLVNCRWCLFFSFHQLIPFPLAAASTWKTNNEASDWFPWARLSPVRYALMTKPHFLRVILALVILECSKPRQV